MSEEKLAIERVVRWALLIYNRPSGVVGIMWRAEAHLGSTDSAVEILSQQPRHDTFIGERISSAPDAL